MSQLKVEVSREVIEEMAQCIFDCNWVSAEELYAYVIATINDTEYDPEEWSVDGRGLIEKDRVIDHE